MLDLYDLLRQIEQKPGMYIGTPSIRNLYMFLNGYQFARRQMKLPLSTQEQEFRAFQPWLQKTFDTKTSVSWCELILAQSSDEIDAFTNFFTFWQTFVYERQASKTTNGHMTNVLETTQL
ncbi:MAG: hypothetical protein KDE19_09765 [Caldilineaceae bacterium]|nr:hypothetical protein [Caldilineaceae bacterium]